MKIAVISDTHIPQRGRNLPPYLLRFLEGVSLILHAGDITAVSYTHLDVYKRQEIYIPIQWPVVMDIVQLWK